MMHLETKEYAKLLLTITTQKHRKNRCLSPLETARDLKILLENDNWNYNSVSRRLKKLSVKQINEFLKLLQIPETVQTIVGWGNNPGKIDFSTAAKIAELDSSEFKDKLFKTIITYNLKKEETDDIIKLLKRNPEFNFEEAVERVIKLRPIVEKGYVIVTNISRESVGLLNMISSKNNTPPKKIIEYILQEYVDINNINKIVIKALNVIITINEEGYLELQKIPKQMKIEQEDLINRLIISYYKKAL